MNLRQIREREGVPIRELARRLGWDYESVFALEVSCEDGAIGHHSIWSVHAYLDKLGYAMEISACKADEHSIQIEAGE